MGACGRAASLDGMWTADAEYTTEAHLAQMTAIFGDIPQCVLARSKHRDRYFDSQGNYKLKAAPEPS